MKNTKLLICLLLITTVSFAQKKDKIKGSKVITTEIKQIESFNSLEVNDNIEVLLVKGTTCGVEIEADDNLHDAIEIVVTGNILHLSTLKKIISAKKLSVRITYTDDFKLIVARDDATISALTEIELDEIEMRSFDSSKLLINAKTKSFLMQNEDKSKVELNLKSENTRISVSKNAKVKALIVSSEMTFDMYQKSDATIEGDVNNLKIRLDNNADFNGSKLNSKNTEIITEAYSQAKINVSENVSIEASGKSEIQLYGDQKIDLKRFVESAVLMKKPTR
jgi:hypothetical protein